MISKGGKKYDLEERTQKFAKDVRHFIKNLPKTLCNTEDAKQLIRSSGSVGANYIEANEALSSKDFVHRLKISRKEAKESRFWLNLIEVNHDLNTEKEQSKLVQESTELMNILAAIVRKVS